MNCTKCGHKTAVKSSQDYYEGTPKTFRTHVCKDCGHRFPTVEVPAEETEDAIRIQERVPTER